jgi:hypothetical protein
MFSSKSLTKYLLGAVLKDMLQTAVSTILEPRVDCGYRRKSHRLKYHEEKTLATAERKLRR